MGLSPIVDPALRDRYYGDWTGRDLEELLTVDPERVSAWLERPHTAPPGGETENDLITRSANWLADLAKPTENPEERRTVVAVVHPAVVRGMVLAALDAPAESLRRGEVRSLAVVTLSLHAGSWSRAFHWIATADQVPAVRLRPWRRHPPVQSDDRVPLVGPDGGRP